uniref:Uncharacterized protein n=1 Tax=Thermoanaerobaculum aquaticum TaxID=1312852 RepID=A0A7C2S8N9_9BACT
MVLEVAMKNAWVVRILATPLAILLWIGLFSYGIMVPSIDLVPAFRAQPSPFSGKLFHWLCAATLSNVLFLSLLTGVLGALYRHLQMWRLGKNGPPGPENLFSDLISGAIRAFLVYLLFVSGTIVVTDQPVASLTQATPGQYITIAATTSVFSFLVGIKPEILTKVVAKLEQIDGHSLRI